MFMSKGTEIPNILLKALLGFEPLWEWLASLKSLDKLNFFLLFSGGPDSSALALTLKDFAELCARSSQKDVFHLLNDVCLPAYLRSFARNFMASSRNIEITLLHLNHRMRPSADDEENWVRSFARRYGFGCATDAVDIVKLAKQEKMSVEEAGRVERYRLLKRHLDSTENSIGFTAHTLDDHAESVLFNLIERTGIGGLLGIAPALHGRILRPFISVSKKQILSFLDERQISYLTDESNLVPDRPRTFLRLEVIPRLVEINPKAKENILATSENLRQYQGLFMWALETISSACLVEHHLLQRTLSIPIVDESKYFVFDVYSWKEELLRSLSVILRYLFEAFGFKIGWSEAGEIADSVRNLHKFYAKISDETFVEFHPPTQLLFVLKRQKLEKEITLDVGGRVTSRSGILTLERVSGNRLEKVLRALKAKPEVLKMEPPPRMIGGARPRSYRAIVSAKIPLPLRVRGWKKGDNLKLYGGGTAKLSDIFANKKIPRVFRESVPIVCDARGKVVWVVGVMRSSDYWIKDVDNPAFVIRWRPST